jgi:HTH-type transcriptional regulator, transcriptional repressor of NAD biosynthesis genes
MKRFSTGLVVGKFCPLHLGHELVIRRALEQCGQVIVLSYTKPEFPNCAVDQRAAWLASRFPSAERVVIDDALLDTLCRSRRVSGRPIPANDAPDGAHRQFVAWLCIEVLGKPVDAVFTSEDYGEGFAAVLAQCFQKRWADAQVTHVSVDRARQLVPVSGTVIRADPYKYKAFLAPEVYASFVRRVCILGGESSGKTTLAEGLAKALGTFWVAEYGRELWDEKSGHLTFDDMLHIAQTQVDRENKALQEARRWLICDTSPLTTLFYSQAMFQEVDPALDVLAGRAYWRTLLCAPDFGFVQDGTRRDEQFRQSQHDWYITQLNQRGCTFTELVGSVEERLRRAVQMVREAT